MRLPRIPLIAIGVFAAFPAASSAASVSVTECESALQPVARTATFQARMEAEPNSRRMQIRFALQSRAQGSSEWEKVSSPGFDSWQTSASGVGRYSYERTVINLAAPATYRAVVSLRWLSGSGKPIRSVRRTSTPCKQLDLRPDVVVRAIATVPDPRPDRRRYVVSVRNTGASPAAAFPLRLTIGANPPLERRISAGLAAQRTTRVVFEGPPCVAGTPLTAHADPLRTLAEREVVANRLSVLCPS